MVIYLIGPAGTGKTVVGRALAARIGCPFVDADDLHTDGARARMARGEALTDADRQPWLGRVRDAASRARASDASGNAVVACSALTRAYRDVLREGGGQVRFLALDVEPAELRRRVADRAATTGHFMPASLVDDQMRTWQPPGPAEPDAVVLPGAGAIADIVESALRSV